MIFDNLESAKSFYKRYALACGFSIRKATQWKSRGTIQGKYFVCSKEGQKAVKEVDTLDEEHKPKQKRRKPSQCTGCEARIRLELTVEVRAFNIMRTIFGGFNHVGATKVDCKNFKRGQNLYISEYDAEMVVQRLMRKKQYLPNFSCEYTTTPDGVLKGLFWADEYAKRNFYTFGDVVSFDATYQHNKYNMVFVPFTAIDNHNCNVTLGAALLGNETAETYTWLLKCFKDAFGYAPKVLVTDQDPAMKRAIEDVFPDTRHRLCMWHIMDKLSGKVGSKLCNETDFKERLCDIVWTYQITPDQFEQQWAA
ncbi:protein FAR1-RELATED SEQUENCE 5-like [Bidens hawaiensis]|uniref:protein FAR1-RELATED SEQUENCE 5-like n=1 Tax=Bidens hawaiensis TaxID=980011 RepID=UPI00404A50FC